MEAASPPSCSCSTCVDGWKLHPQEHHWMPTHISWLYETLPGCALLCEHTKKATAQRKLKFLSRHRESMHDHTQPSTKGEALHWKPLGAASSAGPVTSEGRAGRLGCSHHPSDSQSLFPVSSGAVAKLTGMMGGVWCLLPTNAWMNHNANPSLEKNKGSGCSTDTGSFL